MSKSSLFPNGWNKGAKRQSLSLTVTSTSYDFLKSFLPNICQKGLSLLPMYDDYIPTPSNTKFTMPAKSILIIYTLWLKSYL